MSDHIAVRLPPDYLGQLYGVFPRPVTPSAASIAKAAELRAHGYPVSAAEVEQWTRNGIRVTLE